MIKSAAQIGGLLLAFWPVTSNAQIEMPPLLVGEWRNNTLVERDGGDCTEMGRARGITITEDGKISAHLGDRFCTVRKFEVSRKPRGLTMGAWSYSGVCIVRTGPEVKVVPMHGRMELSIRGEHDKRLLLQRVESQKPMLPFQLPTPDNLPEVIDRYMQCPQTL